MSQRTEVQMLFTLVQERAAYAEACGLHTDATPDQILARIVDLRAAQRAAAPAGSGSRAGQILHALHGALLPAKDSPR